MFSAWSGEGGKLHTLYLAQNFKPLIALSEPTKVSR